MLPHRSAHPVAYFSGLSPKSFFAMFIEYMGVFLRHNNILIDVLTTPAPCVSCHGQAARRAFDKGNTSGLALQNLTVPAVPKVRCSCVVVEKNPHVLVLQVATSLPLLSLAVCRLSDFQGEFLGKLVKNNK